MNTTHHGMLSKRYRLLERLATGGMGEVWRAEDELLGRDVAIKILKDEYASDETFRIRFRAEARNTAGLSHPGIAQMYDYGEQADVAYLVMELVPGQPLSEILYRNERLSPEVTLEIIAQAARALQAAHDAGLIHRDIKPGNLIVDPDGLVKVTDFGIARAVNATTMTQTGTVLGTAQYVSPEQAEGRPLTPATDVYSLGIVAYECLSGHTPFTGESAVAIALSHVRDEPPPLPPDVPDGVRELIGRCLSKEPGGRPQSAGELSNVAYMARESLRMDDGSSEAVTGASGTAAGAGAAGASTAGADTADGDTAGAVSAEIGADGASANEAEAPLAPLHEPAPVPGEEPGRPGTGGDGGEEAGTPPFGTPDVAGAATEASSVTPTSAAAYDTPYDVFSDTPHDTPDGPGAAETAANTAADGVPYRKRVLIVAGAMSVAVICAGALMLGFRWDALVNPAGYSDGGNVPPATPDSASPSWRLSPGWDSQDPPQGRTEPDRAGVPDGERTRQNESPNGETDGDPNQGGDGGNSGDHPEPEPSEPSSPGDGDPTPGSPPPSPTDSSPSPTDTGDGQDDDTEPTEPPSSE